MDCLESEVYDRSYSDSLCSLYVRNSGSVNKIHLLKVTPLEPEPKSPNFWYNLSVTSVPTYVILF